jgi:hypothetical protein
MTHADARPRIYITTGTRGAFWSRHPAAKPTFAISPGAALDDALAEMKAGEAVVIVNATPPGKKI